MLSTDEKKKDRCSECADEGVYVEYFDGIAGAFFCPTHLKQLRQQEAQWDREDASLPDIRTNDEAKSLLEETAKDLDVSMEVLLDPNECFGFLGRSAKLRKLLRYFGGA